MPTIIEEPSVVPEPEAEPVTPLADPRTRGVQIEAKLQEWNIPYTYAPDVALADLRSPDITQIRTSEHRLDHTQVAEYAEQMRHGAIFPPIVLWNETIVIDGTTRIAAAKAIRRKTIAAFHANFPNGDIARVFAAAMNQQNGRRLTREEAHDAALTLLKYGHVEDAVALEVGYSKSQINNWRREADFTERADRTRLPAVANQIPKDVKRKLTAITHDAPFSAATELVARLQPTSKQVSTLLDSIKASTSDAEALEAIERTRQQWAPVGPPPHRVSLPDEMKTARRCVPQLRSLLGHEGLLVEADATKRAEWIVAWREIERLAKQVIDLHG